MNKNLRIEAIRGAAALYVLFHHAAKDLYIHAHAINIHIGALFAFGQEAVIVFFILSGFTISEAFEKKPTQSARAYFAKRFTRIYIPLVFTFLLFYITRSVIAGVAVDPDFKTMLMNLAMLQDDQSTKPGVIAAPYLHNYPLWSLSYEWWFYVLFYPIARYISRATQSYIVIAVGLASAALYSIEPNFFLRVLAYMSIWWSGVLLSRHKNAEFSKTLSVALLPLSIGIIFLVAFHEEIKGLSHPGLHPFLEIRHFVDASLLIAFYAVWKRLHWMGFNVLLRPFAALASVSYGLYITHVAGISLGTYLTDSPGARLTLVLAISLAFSWLIERVLYPIFHEKTMKLILPTGRI